MVTGVVACSVCCKQYDEDKFDECPFTVICEECEYTYHPELESCLCEHPFDEGGENVDDEIPGMTGSGGGGGGSGSGGKPSDSGNNNNNNVNDSIPERTYISKETLEESTRDAVQKMIDQHGTKKAVCNLGVQEAFKNIFGFNPMNGMRANDMVDYWKNSSDWVNVSMSEAMARVEDGYFVVAGWENPTGESGHVVVIVYGSAYSSSWEGIVPYIMDTGDEKRENSVKLSEGFASSKKEGTYFFYFRK